MIEGRGPLDHTLRYLAGLDAEKARLDIKTMALEGHEPLWSMGDDTPTAGRGRVDRPVADHLRQAFAQVTNPAIDPERERVVMDLRVELGRRPALLGGPPRGPRTLRLERPIVADLDGLLEVALAGGRRVRVLDATWPVDDGAEGLARRLERLAAEAVAASEAGIEILLISDSSTSTDRLPVPSILAVGAVHTALTDAGLRGRTDLVVDAADVLDVHAMAMTLAVGATVVHPRLALEVAAELAGSRGAEELAPAGAIENLVDAFAAGLRKTLARMGISAIASYIGGALVDTVDLAPDVIARCFPTVAAWPGRTTLDDIGARVVRRRDAATGAPGTHPRPRASTPRSGIRAVPRRRRGPPLRTADRERDPGPVGRDADGRWRAATGRRARAVSDRAVAARRRAIDASGRASATSARPSGDGRFGRERAVDRPQVRRLGHERRGPLAGSAPGADDRHPARGWCREHRRGWRGPGVVRRRHRTADAATPGSSRSPRRGSG